MGEDFDPTAQPPEDSTEGTLEEGDGDTGEETPTDTAPVDWQSRYKELQSATDRRLAQMDAREKRLAAREQALKVVAPEPEPGPDDLSTLPPHLRREVEEARALREQYQEQEVRAQFGPELVDLWHRHFDGPVDPEALGGIMAFIGDLAQGAEKQGTRKPSRSEAVQPRVDTNRPDTPDLTALDKQIADAKALKGKDPLGSGVSALLRKAGL